MNIYFFIFILVSIASLIYTLTVRLYKINNNNQNSNPIDSQTQFVEKPLMTNSELHFYSILKSLEPEYNVLPQVNLGSIVDKVNGGFRNELFKNIDFAIFDKNYSKVLLLIELNDHSHQRKDRKNRDESVKRICQSAGIKLIFFYTSQPNEMQYVINRVRENLDLNNINNYQFNEKKYH